MALGSRKDARRDCADLGRRASGRPGPSARGWMGGHGGAGAGFAFWHVSLACAGVAESWTSRETHHAAAARGAFPQRVVGKALEPGLSQTHAHVGVSAMEQALRSR